MSVQFFFLQKAYLKNRTALKQQVVALFKKEKRALESINIIFCSDDYLLEINKSHLNHNYYTDIITFDLTAGKNQPIIAELYISVDRVKDNAQQLQQTFTREIHRVIFHGCLHLCGYKDKSAADIKKMRSAEDKYIKLHFF
jgi:probable rRNA maturation factor